jgi:hypothetical protein
MDGSGLTLTLRELGALVGRMVREQVGLRALMGQIEARSDQGKGG